MNVLRRNKDSLMAVLEAFVYDPLLNWRLLDSDRLRRSKNAGDMDSVSGSMHEDSLLSYNARRDARLNELNATTGPAAGGQPSATVNVPSGGTTAAIPVPSASGAAVPPGGDAPDGNYPAMQNPVDVTNKKARAIVDRVKDKLTGKDFGKAEPVAVNRQIDLLIQQATSNENLCQCYIGWCPFW